MDANEHEFGVVRRSRKDAPMPGREGSEGAALRFARGYSCPWAFHRGLSSCPWLRWIHRSRAVGTQSSRLSAWPGSGIFAAEIMLKCSPWVLGASLALGGLVISCSQGGRSGAPDQSAVSTNVTTYHVKGVIREVFPEKKKVRITHEDIPGYMEAMTMMLDVRDARDLASFQPGDSVSFRMLVTEDDGWIDQLKKIDGPRTPLPAEPSSLRRVREVDPLAVGDKLPDYTFTNTAGRVIRLSDYKGRALGLTFIFTRCPFPTFCPRLSSNFAEAQSRLKALPEGVTNWNLLSITIDPEFDTPERLKGYAERYKADPQHWDHVTGALIDITAIGEQFGLQFWRANPNEPINHNVRTVVVDAAGRVQWVTNENEWKADTFVEQMVRAARAKPEADAAASAAKQP